MSSEQKIYTKTGDKGETSLIGGTRVLKYNLRIETYGTVDELNAFIGLIRDQDIERHYKTVLIEIQNRLFTLGSLLARDHEKNTTRKISQILDKDVEFLEREIDAMNKELKPVNSFILPGGHPIVSYCHIARCICRRAERMTVRLTQDYPVDELNIQYLNRLSDYLFVLARRLSKDLDATETFWVSGV
ncbi:MAG: cob(I)yrinic acid a,c-diamide adenosyltransferase [Bacteroidetes bacterium]|nr:cob(I)yrinic acid a,c-diamide adenosyltransferase [Bacteroidota bacterium]